MTRELVIDASALVRALVGKDDDAAALFAARAEAVAGPPSSAYARSLTSSR